ncbi:type II secretion system GspH family protein [Patescibacteria group bacterium]|nr:type II secretion system GspH family protein [Patescibacteria group bacterium]
MKQVKSKGFTLIELLVVISIIGFLATASMVVFNNVRMKARDTKRKSDLKQLSTAIQLYYDANSSYPDNATSYPDWPAGFKTELLPFLNKPPVDPKDDGWRYYGAYRMTWAPDSNCNDRYVLWAYLENYGGEYSCGFGNPHFFVVLDKY